MSKAVKYFFLILSFAFVFSYPAKAQIDPNLNNRLRQAPIIVNHNHIGLLEQIPDGPLSADSNQDCVDDNNPNNIDYICKAKKIKMIFGNRSVGVNTNDALNCLHFESDEICYDARPACAGVPCTVPTHPDPRYNSPESAVDWYYPGGYTRTNWTHELFNGTWDAMTTDYITLLDNNQVQGGRSLSNFDVYSFQFSYLNVGDNDTIANQPGGFFYDNSGDKNDVYDLERRLTQHNNKYFIYFSSSLSRAAGNQVSTNFNNQMRQFVQQKDTRGQYRILFDFADIESYDPYGNPCYDNRDGVEYCQSNTGNCENEPNDGHNYPAICQHYTSELLNGHLTQAPAKIRIAKGMWVLMAQMAGWNPQGSNPPNPTPTPTPRPTATPTPNRRPGDANNDGRVDGFDYMVWLNHYYQDIFGPEVGDFNSSGKVDGVDYMTWLNNYDL
jgi:hypothetical protein